MNEAIDLMAKNLVKTLNYDLKKAVAIISEYIFKFFDENPESVELDLIEYAYNLAENENDINLLVALKFIETLSEKEIKDVIESALKDAFLQPRNDIRIIFNGFSFGLPDDIYPLRTETVLEATLIDKYPLTVLEVKELRKKGDGDEIKTEKLIICKINTIEHIYNPVDKVSLLHVNASKIKGNEIIPVEVLDIKELEKLYSSTVVSKLKKDTLLYSTLHDAMKTLLLKHAQEVIKVCGFAIIETDGKITIPGTYQTQDVVFSEDFEKFRKLVLDKEFKTPNWKKRAFIECLAKFNKAHNLTTIGAFFASHLIHIVKPTIVPPIFIWGDSGIGKTSLAMLLSYSNPSSTQTTLHQILQHISGFRNGIVYFDEKIEWGGQVLQEIKYASTNFGYLHRKSHNKHYFSNMMVLATSNPKPKFKIKGLEDLKGIVRRSIFLEVLRELDAIDDKSIDEAYDFLDVHREELINFLIEELLQFDVETLKELYDSTGTYKEKYRMIVLGLKVWQEICKRYNVELNINIDKLISRYEKSEKEVLGLGELSFIDLIKSKILEDMVDIAKKIGCKDACIYVVIRENNVIKAVLETKHYAVVKQKNGNLKIVFTVQGYKNLSESIKELPLLDNSKDISNYLKSINIEFEYKHAKVAGVLQKYFTIEVPETDDSEAEDIEVEELSNEVLKLLDNNSWIAKHSKVYNIIKEATEKGELISYMELLEKTGFDEDTLDKILDKLKRDGDIDEPFPSKYRIL